MVNGTIDAATVRWNKEVTDILDDYEKRNLVLPDDFYWRKDKKYYVDVDHIYNSPYTEDVIDLGKSTISFNLDDVVLPAGMVVTGNKTYIYLE